MLTLRAAAHSVTSTCGVGLWSYHDLIAATGDSTETALGRLDTRSLSGRVRDELLKAIHNEGFPEGRLPPEADLAVQLGVSRTTVRAALQSLADDGIVSRRRRHGTVINRHVLRSSMGLNRLVSFRALIEQSGHVPSVDPQVHRAQIADEDAAEALGLQAGTRCLIVKRLLRAGGEPVIHITDTVALDRLGDLGAIIDADSTFEFLAANGVGTVDHVRAEIVPRVADRTQPRELEVAPGTAYIELRETLFTREHDRIAFSRIAVDDTLVRFSLVRRDI
jgi:GntR family transcriptional regulator